MELLFEQQPVKMLSLLTPEEYMKDKIFLGTKSITEIRSTGNTGSSSKSSGFIALFTNNIGAADKNSYNEYENQQWLEILLYDGAYSYQGRLKPSDIHNVLEQQVQSQQQQTQSQQGSQFTVNFLSTPTPTATKTTGMNTKLEKIEKYLLGCELQIKDMEQIQIKFESQHSSLVKISITKLKHTCSFNVKLCEITLKKVVNNNEYNNTKPCNDMLYIQLMTYIMQSQHSQISQTNAQIKDLTQNYERCKQNLLIMEKRVNSDSSNLLRNFLDLSNDTKAKHLRQLQQQQKVTSMSEENNENTMRNDNTNKKENGKSDTNILTSTNKKNDRKTKSKNSHVDNTTTRKKIKLREEERQTQHLSQINNNSSYLADNGIIEKLASGARVTDQDLFPQSQSLSQQQHPQTIINNNFSRKEKYKTHSLSQSQYSQPSLQSISSANKQNRKNLPTKSTSSLSSISLMSTPLTSTQQLNSENDDKGSMSGSETVKIDGDNEILGSSMSVEVKSITEKNNDIIIDQTENESNEEEEDEEEDDETVSSVELL